MYDLRHWRFIYQSLQDLQNRLAPFQGKVWICHGEVLPILECIAEEWEIHSLLAHQETGVSLTFERDKTLSAYCQQQGIAFREFPQDGVGRALKHRWGWADRRPRCIEMG